MREIVMYECDYCNTLHEFERDAIECEQICKEQLECTHEKIRSKSLYGDDPSDYICAICNKSAHKDFLKYERKRRLDGIFEKQDASLEGWREEEKEFREKMKEYSF